MGLAKDSVTVSFGLRTLWGPRLIKDPKNVKNHWFYYVFVQQYWKSIGFIVCSLQRVENHCVLLSFRWKCRMFIENPCAKMQRTQKCWKTIGFIMFSIKNAKILKNHWFYCFLAQKHKKGRFLYIAFICFLINKLHF